MKINQKEITIRIKNKKNLSPLSTILTLVDKETKKFNHSLILSCKSVWDFSKKEKHNDIIQNWQIMFQASSFKENHFLDLLMIIIF